MFSDSRYLKTICFWGGDSEKQLVVEFFSVYDWTQQSPVEVVLKFCFSAFFISILLYSNIYMSQLLVLSILYRKLAKNYRDFSFLTARM